MRAIKIHPSITPRSQKSLERYLSEISKYDVLSPDEELQLFKAYRAGDESAYLKIVQCNLRFVVSVAKQYMYCGLSLNDLINEGNDGLMEAARRFDHTRGFKFISYAVWWIRQRLIRAINNLGYKVRRPLNQHKQGRALREAELVLTQELNRRPSTQELAEYMDMSEEQIDFIRRSDQKSTSLDAMIGYDDERTRLDTLIDTEGPQPNEKLYKDESQSIMCKELLAHLTPREAKIVAASFGVGEEEEQTLHMIADRMDLSLERVRQIRQHALRKLRRIAERLPEGESDIA